VKLVKLGIPELTHTGCQHKTGKNAPTPHCIFVCTLHRMSPSTLPMTTETVTMEFALNFPFIT